MISATSRLPLDEAADVATDRLSAAITVREGSL